MNVPAENTLQAAGCTLETRIGGGSSGEVWRARRDDQIVAVKFLKDALLQSNQREKHLARFRTEIAALQRLADQPNVPHLYDFSLDEQRPYLIMEYIEGEGFGKLLQSGEMLQIPLRKRLDLLHDIAQALDTAHEARILHRDIKPSNMRGTAQAYLLDFSVALDLHNTNDDLRGQVGTRLYKPPQGGDPAALFRDRFGFAVVCYEILFGRHPFFLREEITQHGADLEEVARLRLWSRTWYRPAALEAAILPPNLAGAHLQELDGIFQQAFEGDNFGGAVTLVEALRGAIDTPENADMIDLLPEPAAFTHQTAGTDYTEIEMQIQAAHTETGTDTGLRWWWIGIPAALLILLIGLGLQVTGVI